MTGIKAIGRKLTGLAALLALAGCSSASSGLTTGSLLPGAAAKPAADPVMERAVQVGTISAKASKCGYNFDPQKLKANYLAFETAQPGADATRIEKTFETTRAVIASKIDDPTEFCTDGQTAKIKGDLTRHLAGDFNPPAKKVEGGLLDTLAGKEAKPFNPQEAFCPQQTCY